MEWLALALTVLTTSMAFCYDAKFDNMDVDRIIASDTMFTAYINCILDKGPCDIEHSAEIKELLPEVIAEACAKCSDVQKKHMRKVVKFLFERKPVVAEEFRNRFDPKGIYEEKFKAFLFEEN